MKCGACGRTLKDAKSIMLGYGKTCYKKLIKQLAAEKKEQEAELLDFVAELAGRKG